MKESNYGDVDYILSAQRVRGPSGSSDTNLHIDSGTSAASPLLAGIMAIFVGYEGLNKPGDVATVYDRVKTNSVEGIISGIPQLGPLDKVRGRKQTPNLFATTGISLVADDSPYPYLTESKKSVRAMAEDGTEFDEKYQGQTGMWLAITLHVPQRNNPLTSEIHESLAVNMASVEGSSAMLSNSIDEFGG